MVLGQTHRGPRSYVPQFRFEYERTRNILFLDVRTGTTSWLFPDTRHVITQMAWLSANAHDPEVVPASLLILAVPESTHREPNASGTIYIADPGGQKLQKVAGDVTSVSSTRVLKDEILIIYESTGTKYYAVYSAASLDPVRSGVVTLPPL